MTGLDLRPLSLAEILDRTFSLYRRHFLLFFGIAIIPHLLTLAWGLAQIFFLNTAAAVTAATNHPDAVPFSFHAAGLTLITSVVAIVLAMFVYVLSQGGTVFALSEIYLGRQTSIGASLRRAGGSFASVLGVVVLNVLAIGGACLFLLIPGIYVACRLLVSVPSAVVEGRGPGASLSRSWNLTRGDAGRAFVLFLTYCVLAVGAGLLISVPLLYAIASALNNPAMLRLWLCVQQVLGVFLNSAVEPFILIGSSVFYFDLRVRKEAFDLQFMMDPTSERVTGTGDSVSSIPS